MRHRPVEVQAGGKLVSLLNRRQVRTYTLNVAKSRAHMFTRVSEAFLIDCEVQLKAVIRERIHRLPSVGRTIK